MKENIILIAGKIAYQLKTSGIVAFFLQSKDESAVFKFNVDLDIDYIKIKIAELNTEEDGENNVWLKHVEVEQKYHGCDVEQTMLNLAKDYLYLTKIPDRYKPIFTSQPIENSERNGGEFDPVISHSTYKK